MQIVKTENSPTNISLKITGDSTDLAPIKRHVLDHFKDVKVPGFRAGRAPLELIEKSIDQQKLLDEFMEHALNDLFVRAVETESLQPVGQPDVKLKKFVPYSELEFDVTIDVVGPVKLANYKSIKLAKPKVEVTAKDVNDVLDTLRQRLAERAEVTRPAHDGDEVIIDFSGKDSEGKPVAGADGKDYPLVLGSKTFIPGFEENLTGLKAGDKKDFKITFPKDYGVAALRSREVSFSVEAKKVSQLSQPKLDDAFAKKAGAFSNLAELKADIKKQVKSEKQYQADRDFENRLIQAISEKSKLEVPEALVDNEIAQMEAQEKNNLAYRGQTWQEHLQAEGLTEEEHRQRQRPDALVRVKAGLILSEIAKAEKVTVAPEELDIRLQILKGQYQDPAMQAELAKPEARRDIEARLLTEKTIAKLTEYASK
ncbi:MAG TPA: trigger factor [Candidatus Saccharimonadales bacterium]|nr:trigger factor [Candidatus Saccharimonadales bacterium]